VRLTDPTGYCAEDDEECNEVADLIESETNNYVTINRCQGGAVGCKHWSAKELRLLWETYQRHLLKWAFEQGYIVFVREEGNGFGATSSKRLASGAKYADISIYDYAWFASPSARIFASIAVEIRRESGAQCESCFQGLIAHELTHAAQWFEADLTDMYMEAQSGWIDFYTKPNLLVGYEYGWDYYKDRLGEGPALARVVAQEMKALMVSPAMYDRRGLGNPLVQLLR